MESTHFKSFAGELIGTFILVFLGCGSVAVAVLYNSLSLPAVAAIWGLGVFLGIVASRKLSNAHLNPAVSAGFLSSGQLKLSHLPAYLIGQFAGAFGAAGVLYLIFANGIAGYEATNGILRASETAYHSAMMFGEYYPNPGYENVHSVTTALAFLLEACGTAILMLSIYILSIKLAKKPMLCALGIGLTVSLLIIVIAPYTQAGFNPARDLSPRLFSWLAGWETGAFASHQSPLLVYVLGPVTGTVMMGVVYRFIIKMQQQKKT